MTQSDSQSTVRYYDEHADEFCGRTIGLDLADLRERFLRALPNGAKVLLDAGCGSGRDALAFGRRGYRVDAFDASAGMAARASAVLGWPVRQLRFQDLRSVNCYDGIWANASLLHVPRRDMDDVLNRLTAALRPSGVLYASFKQGEGEEVRDGRLFNAYSERGLRALFAGKPDLEEIDLWSERDERPEHREEWWLNVLLRKMQAAAMDRLAFRPTCAICGSWNDPARRWPTSE